MIFRLIVDEIAVVFCFRYTNVSVGMADVEEGLGVSKPVFPHEVTTFKLLCVCVNVMVVIVVD